MSNSCQVEELLKYKKRTDSIDFDLHSMDDITSTDMHSPHPDIAADLIDWKSLSSAVPEIKKTFALSQDVMDDDDLTIPSCISLKSRQPSNQNLFKEDKVENTFVQNRVYIPPKKSGYFLSDTCGDKAHSFDYYNSISVPLTEVRDTPDTLYSRVEGCLHAAARTEKCRQHLRDCAARVSVKELKWLSFEWHKTHLLKEVSRHLSILIGLGSKPVTQEFFMQIKTLLQFIRQMHVEELPQKRLERGVGHYTHVLLPCLSSPLLADLHSALCDEASDATRCTALLPAEKQMILPLLRWIVAVNKLSVWVLEDSDS